jgi:nucleoside 2-deoxyribosyltransferase
MPRAYIAGPLFDPGERWYLEQVDAIARELGFLTYLPHRDGASKWTTDPTTTEIFQADLRGLESADLVVAVLNGPDVDSGTAWELGHAYAREVPIVGIQEDIRLKDAAAQMNLVVYHSAQVVCASLEELRGYLLQLGGHGQA